MNYSRSGLIRRWLLSFVCLTLLCCLCFSSVALADLGQGPTSYDLADNACDDLGYLPQYENQKLTDAENRGRCTWYLWTGDGDDALYRTLAVKTHGKIDLLRAMDSRQHDQRFAQMGLINDPGCKKAEKPDRYGLWLDECQDPHSAGAIGMRKYTNPNFDSKVWDVNAYNLDPSLTEPPYRIGISCASCHVAFNPLKPPTDPEHPRWENLVPTIGNQYFREAAIFSANFAKVAPQDFVWHVLNTQEPGTSDTSRIATDSINNPNAINSIFYLADRPTHEEIMPDGSKKAVNHILKDGADSIGIPGASVRVYVNIGTCSDYWLSRQDALLGRVPQRPFDVETARKECKGYGETEARMADAEAFLKTQTPLHLENAEGGEAFLTQDEAMLTRGKIAFASTCAQCHSSKQPPAQISINPEKAKQWYQDSVLSSDFLEHNFLSDDKRYPITEIGTNAGRALATNATRGHIWEQSSSKTYKDLPSPGTLTLENPIDPKEPIEFDVPAGGTGYYRTPSLISVWATAPLLHNNALGLFNGDPSVEGRVEAYNDAMEKLLWPEKRDRVIKQTSQDSILSADGLVNVPLGLQLPIPQGTPVNLLANINVRTAIEQFLALKPSLKNLDLSGGIPGVISRLLLDINQSPDFIEDRGHLYGADLSDEDKHALIEFVKTF